jgi:hypothetical protein
MYITTKGCDEVARPTVEALIKSVLIKLVLRIEGGAISPP